MKRNTFFRTIKKFYSKIVETNQETNSQIKKDVQKSGFELSQVQNILSDKKYLYWYKSKYDNLEGGLEKNFNIQQIRNKVDPNNTYVSAFDGASKQQGKSSCGFIIYRPDKKVLHKDAFFTGMNTNNYAEFLGAGIKNAVVYGDSELTIKALKNQYNIKEAKLKEINLEMKKNVKLFNSIEFKHVYRQQNVVADKLCNDVFANFKGTTKTKEQKDNDISDNKN